MEKQFENIVIINSLMTDDDIQAKVEKICGFIKANKGTVVHSENWGRRRLAYPIKKFNRGFYHLIYFKGSGKTVKELELQCSYDEDILRCFTSSVDDIETSYNEFITLKNDPSINLNLFKETTT